VSGEIVAESAAKDVKSEAYTSLCVPPKRSSASSEVARFVLIEAVTHVTQVTLFSRNPLRPFTCRCFLEIASCVTSVIHSRRSMGVSSALLGGD